MSPCPAPLQTVTHELLLVFLFPQFPTQRFARKASSASSLRLSPPKRHRNKAASASSPSSPVRQHQQQHHHHHYNQQQQQQHSHQQGAYCEDKLEDGCEHTQGLTVISKGYKTDKAFRDDQGCDIDPQLSQSPPCYYAVIQRRKQEVTTASSDDSGVTVVSTTPSRDPAFRRSFPASHSSSDQPHFPSPAPSISGAKSSSALPSEAATLQRRNVNISGDGQPSTTSRERAGPATTLGPSRGNSSAMPNKSASAPTSGTATPIRRGGSSSLRHGDVVRPSSAVSDMAHQRSSGTTFPCTPGGSSSSPKHVQISDIVSVNITGDSPLSTNNFPAPNPNLDKPNGILKRDNSFRRDRDSPATGILAASAAATLSQADDGNFFTVSVPQVQTTSFVAGDDGSTSRESSATPPLPPPPPPIVEDFSEPHHPSPSRKNNNLRVDISNTSTLSPNIHKNSSSSESPEWPSPPEPLTPQTPQTPNAGAAAHMSFDSDTIQRMLRSLPSSPLDRDNTDNLDQGFHEDELDPGYSQIFPHTLPRYGENPKQFTHPDTDPSTQLTEASRRPQEPPSDPESQAERRSGVGRGLFRTKSLTVHDRHNKLASNPRRQQTIDTPYASASSASHKPRMFNKIALEKELKKRNRNIAANYPDSGIGMGPGEVSSSLRSEPKMVPNTLILKSAVPAFMHARPDEGPKA
ncbi:fam-a protein [Plakobranchus ocellatus]|uniref:Fam-a protein n=1 Tax=Plakobranchus ocellatus TaxID=259542 RepID=A0AAV4C111_9GAST|nr:fam-a protein [Plakobranchus ocellatus]